MLLKKTNGEWEKKNKAHHEIETNQEEEIVNQVEAVDL